jgi:hypothetical protein
MKTKRQKAPEMLFQEVWVMALRGRKVKKRTAPRSMEEALTVGLN